MKQIELTDLVGWDELLRQIEREDIVLTRRGQAVALLSEIDQEELYWRQREKDPAFIASLVRARDQAKQRKTISHQKLKRKLGLD
jgi:hypothetical protein